MKTLAHILAASWAVLIQSAYGANYYVNDGSTSGDIYCSATGRNSNAGTTPSTPKANAEAIIEAYDLNAGDTIWVDTGTYYPTNPSSADPAIKFTHLDGGAPGSYVTLQGSTNYAAGGTVLNRGSTAYDTIICYSTEYVAVRSARLTGGRFGLFVWLGSNIVVDACDIVDNSAGGGQLRNCQNINITRTRVHSNSGRGFDIWEGDYSVFFDHCSVWDNHDNASGPGVWAEIWYSRDASTYSLLSISNSVVLARGQNHHCIHSDRMWFCPYVGNYNDLVALDGAYFISSDSPYYANLSSWQTATTQDLNSISLDPQFTDDGHLKSREGTWSNGWWVVFTTNSPCIDRGNPSSIFTNEPAPNGGRINIGAFGNTGQASKTADFDGDGLSDVSECFDYFTNPNMADSDNDGYNDRSELIAGTTATNGSSFFDMDGLPATNRAGFSMRWFGNSGRNYQPQWRTNLISGVWSNCTGLVNPTGQPIGSLAGTNGWVTAVDTNAGGKMLRFFRIKVTKP